MLKKLIIVFSLMSLSACAVPTKNDTVNPPATIEQAEVQSEIINEETNEVNLENPEIINYLLSQEDFSWKTIDNGTPLCVYYNWQASESYPLYLWVRCGEFYVADGLLKEASGMSGPAVIKKATDGTLSHFAPMDGTVFATDTNHEFPNVIRQEIKNNSDKINLKLNQSIIDQASLKMGAMNITDLDESLKASCEVAQDCQTPMAWLMRSSCPWTSKCENHRCQIYCPQP